jgi:hypothetical protein
MARIESPSVSVDHETRGIEMTKVWIAFISAMLAVALCGCSPQPDLPPAGENVTAVTRAYLIAAKAGKCDVTKALTLDHTWAWCSNPTLKSFEIAGKPEVYPAQKGVPIQTCVPTLVTSHASADAAVFEGRRSWQFCFVHKSDGWRLYDQGQG